MPAYGTPQAGGVLTCLYPGDSMLLFNNEAVTVGEASIAFSRGITGNDDVGGGTFQAYFTGTQSVQVQGSNTDANADYVNVGSPMATSDAFYVDASRFAFYRVVAADAGTLTVRVQR